MGKKEGMDYKCFNLKERLIWEGLDL